MTKQKPAKTKKAQVNKPIPATDPAMFGAIMAYSTSAYQVFNRLTWEQCQEAVNACSQFSLEYPLHLRDKSGEFPKRDIPHFGERSSINCMAIMSAWLVWTQKVLWDNPLPESPLLGATKDGLALWDKKELSPYWKGRSRP
jgi:hypothetical protein